MTECPVCLKKKKEKLSLYSLIPLFRLKKCFNCRKHYIWIRVFRKNYFLKNESLLKRNQAKKVSK